MVFYKGRPLVEVFRLGAHSKPALKKQRFVRTIEEIEMFLQTSVFFGE
jgi:hypothetical protein